MRIYPDTLPPTSTRTGRPWWILRASIDPLVMIGTYLLVLAVFHHRFTQDDLALLSFGLLLAFPGEVPFRRFTTEIARNVLVRWLKVALAVAAFWIAKSLLVGLGFQTADMVIVTWLLATPLLQILLHSASPRIVPFIWPLLPPGQRVAIVGVNHVATRIAQWIHDGEAEGQQLVGYFDDRDVRRLAPAGHPVIGPIAQVAEYVKGHGIDVIYISMPMSTHPRITSLLQALGDTTASVYFLPDVFVADMIQGRVTTLAGLPAVSVCESPFDSTAGVLKRALDLVLTASALPFLAPLMLVIGALVRATSPGPAIFKQKRYGLDGKEIVVWKFRTMTTQEDGDRTYTQVTRADPRVTPLGRILRKTSLDELPQLLNVLCGSMSLVGPRPHALAVNEQYRKLIPGYMVRHKVKPGITGWAQVNGCRGGDDLESMRRRTEYDLAYLRSWSLALDLLIIAKTVKVVIAGDERAY